jgi:hypothetical protein
MKSIFSEHSATAVDDRVTGRLGQKKTPNTVPKSTEMVDLCIYKIKT